MDEYRDHPSKVAQWDGSQLIPLADVPGNAETVWVALPPEDGTQYWEGLRSRIRPDGLAELRAVPAYARNLNFGDLVSTVRSADGALVCTAVVRQSGQWTFHVWFPEASTTSWQSVAQDYAKAGCLVDVLTPHLMALSCSSVLSQQIADNLLIDQNRGLLDYETGRSQA